MRTTTIRTITMGAALAAVLTGASRTSYAGDHHGAELAQLRAATASYHRHQVAVDRGGFALELADLSGLTCIEDPSGTGAMGTHWVNLGEVGDGEVDITEPEVLLYDMSQPEPRLLGVEYVVLVADWGEDRDPPILFGHEFHLVEAGNRYGLADFYEMHAWIWHHNPSGMFNDWNPRVDC